MKKSSFLEHAQKPGHWAAEDIGNKFADPLPDEEVTEYREIFGLSCGFGEGTDALRAVAMLADS